jgi:hypothetical protein
VWVGLCVHVLGQPPVTYRKINGGQGVLEPPPRPLSGRVRPAFRALLAWVMERGRWPPAPKPAGLSLGSPSFSILFLKINELEKYLVVARCTDMCLRMHRVPPISPSAKTRRIALSSQTRFGLRGSDLSVLRRIQFFASGPLVSARSEASQASSRNP